MFCSKCGHQFADGSAFCPNCGQSVNAAPQQPVVGQQPVYQQPVYQQPVAPQQTAPAGDWIGMVKKNLALILLIIGCFGVLMFVLNTFQILELPLTAEVSGLGSNTESGSVSDIADLLDAAGKSFVLGYIANIIIGVANLAVAAIGILYFLKEKNNMPYYDQFIGKNLKGFSPLFAMGVIGAAGAVLQFVLMLFTGYSESAYGMKASVSVGVHWLTWVSLVIYAAVAAVDFLFINKKK